MDEELKPCPFCGKEQQVEHYEGDGDIVDPPCIGEYFTLAEWQNAYCWKELDTLRKQNEELKSELSARIQLSNSWAEATISAQKQIEDLKARAYAAAVAAGNERMKNNSLKKKLSAMARK